jgi:hypothetical protein
MNKSEICEQEQIRPAKLKILNTERFMRYLIMENSILIKNDMIIHQEVLGRRSRLLFFDSKDRLEKDASNSSPIVS